ncbi:unnamed protein product [Chrysodeixis includens]|uniref:Anaphase-promoting complex subunit 4-like WD40 domain-containing protein n=1 Tax=Chrysodeixis includens TaxID=689277 RepID=A0A9P0BRE4_CHRIL|nr:unnamed protein product [Chrysodeixis includens]
MASKVHKVRYYNPKPLSINCISYNKTNKQIAVAREDASIEIWDLKHAPYLLKFIPGLHKGSVEALGWVKDRLLATGLAGALHEWNLNTLTLKTSVLLTGYAAWCLDVNSDNTLVAVGTEQGYVNLFSVEHGQITYKKIFDKQEGRIMCCKFNKEGNKLVTGSVNTIRVWDAETGHAITRMSVLRKNKEIIVWCLAILSDNTIVSGDSQGKLIFWDSKIGDQIESYSTNKLNLMSLVVSEDETSIFCGGSDSIIMNFIKVNKSTEKQTEAHWVKNVQRNIHERDVRGLVVDDEKLISVGVDGFLTFSSYPPKWVMRLPPMIPGPRSSICRRKKLLLLRYSNHLEVWKLGSYATNNNGNVLITNVISTQDVTVTNVENNEIEEDSTILNGANAENTLKKSLKLTEKPVKLASIQTKGKNNLWCCALSPSGELVVYSTASDVRILKLETDEDQSNISLSKVSITGIPKVGCDRVAFTEDSSTLVAHSAGVLHVLQVDPEVGATPVQVITLEKYLKSKSILHLYVSSKSPTGVTYMVVADTLGNVAVWTQSNKKFEFYVSLPTYQCVPSALIIDIQRENLIIAYVDQKIVEYELKQKRFSAWPGGAVPAAWAARRAAVTALHLHPARHALLAQDDTSLWVLERDDKEAFEPATKKRSMSDNNDMAFKVIPFKYLADFHWIDKDEAVVIEILPESIIAQLPAILT